MRGILAGELRLSNREALSRRSHREGLTVATLGIAIAAQERSRGSGADVHFAVAFRFVAINVCGNGFGFFGSRHLDGGAFSWPHRADWL